MIALDTNVLVRYLVQDDPAQAKLATKFIETNCTEGAPCFIGQIVLCELAWVLDSNYDQDRQQIASSKIPLRGSKKTRQFEDIHRNIALAGIVTNKYESANDYFKCICR